MTNKVLVIPHQKLEGGYFSKKEPVGGRKLKLAFLGNPVNSKGWGVWNSLIQQAQELYDYFVFYSNKKECSGAKKIRVQYDLKALNPMIGALRKEDIDIVLLWSICPETYSYTYFESFAANAFVITNSVSGNICAMVKKNKNGIVLENEEELFKLIMAPKTLEEIYKQYIDMNIVGPERLVSNDRIVQITTLQNYQGRINLNNQLWTQRKRASLLCFFVDKLYKRLEGQ